MSPKKFFQIMTGVVIVSLAVLGGAFYLSSQSLTSKRIEYENKLAEEAVAVENVSQLEKLTVQYNNVKDLSDEIEKVLPNEKQQSEVVAILVKLAKNSNVDLSGINFDPTSGLPGATTQTQDSDIASVKALPARFQVTGTYNQLYSFLTSIETTQRQMQVSNLSVAPASEEGSTVRKLTFSITLNAYFMP